MDIIDILFIISIAFFLFDFYLFSPIRNYLSKCGYILNKLMKCSFCQGFWVGTSYYIIYYGISFEFIRFGFSGAILFYTWKVILYKPSNDMENG